VINGAFDGKETVEVNPVGRCSAIVALDPSRPRLGEAESNRLAQNIDSVWRNTELQDLVRFVDRHQRRTAEILQCAVGPPNILLVGIDPDIDVLGITRFGVIDEGEPTDDQIPHAVPGKEIQNVLEVLDDFHRSAARCGRFASGGLDQRDVSVDGNKRREPLFRGSALPEIEIPQFGFGERCRPMCLHRRSTLPAPFFKVYHNQYFSTATGSVHTAISLVS
jgi:hypothetical protein